MATGGDPGDLNFRLDLVGLTLLDRYKVESLLGKGGMASVYRATDERLARTVVVKVPDPAFLAEEGFIERFALEIRSLTTLEHPHIVKVLDSGSTRGVPYAVLQFLGGGSLDQWMEKQGKLTTAEVLEWLPFMADALDFIHLQGVVHRDVKPANILRDKDGHFFLADFGIAKALAANEGHGVTKTGMVPGSPEYMAPEAVQSTPLTAAYDQYALALTVYQALAGKLPFAASTPLQTLVEKSLHKVRPIRELVPDLPIASAGAVMRALQQEPAKRHATCTEFAQAFFSGLGIEEPTGAHPVPGKISHALGAKSAASRSKTGGGGAQGDHGSGAPPPDFVEMEPLAAPRTLGRAVALVALSLALLGAAGWFFFLRGGGDRASRAKELRYEAMTLRGQRNLDGAYEGALAALAMHDDEEGRALRDSIAASIGRRLESVLTIEAPAEGAVVGGGRIEVRGRLGETSVRMEKVLLDGGPASLSDGVFKGTVEGRPDGPRKIDVVAVERHGFTGKKAVSVVVDGTPPEFTVTNPAEGAVVAANVALWGSVRDAASVSVSVGSTSIEPAAPDAEGNHAWATTIDLKDMGPAGHDLRFEARDAAGNVTAVVRHVRVDATAPKVAITSPASGFETSETSVEVRGTIDDPDAFLSVDGEEAARNRDGTFARTVPLPEEGSRDIVVAAKDAAGNETTATIRVTRRAPSSIEIESPAEGAWIASRRVEVSVTTEGPAPVAVRVNGRPATQSGVRWAATVDVEEGDAEIVVEASGRGGGVARARRLIHIDTTPPKVVLLDPAEGAALSAGEFVVTGSVTDARRCVLVVKVDNVFAGRWETPPDAATGLVPFQVRLALAAGARVISVQARDSLQNAAPPVERRVTVAGGGAMAPAVEVAVPHLVGKTASAARALLVSLGLVASPVILPDPAAPALQVTSQIVVAGTKVAPGTAVVFRVSAPKSAVRAPDVVGKTQSQAEDALLSVGLMSTVVQVVDPKRRPPGSVIEQSPAAGEPVAPGMLVTLKVAKP